MIGPKGLFSSAGGRAAHGPPTTARGRYPHDGAGGLKRCIPDRPVIEPTTITPMQQGLLRQHRGDPPAEPFAFRRVLTGFYSPVSLGRFNGAALHPVRPVNSKISTNGYWEIARKQSPFPVPDGIFGGEKSVPVFFTRSALPCLQAVVVASPAPRHIGVTYNLKRCASAFSWISLKVLVP